MENDEMPFQPELTPDSPASEGSENGTKKTFADTLIALREAEGCTPEILIERITLLHQIGLSDEIGMSINNLQMLEKGKRSPTRTSIERISLALSLNTERQLDQTKYNGIRDELLKAANYDTRSEEQTVLGFLVKALVEHRLSNEVLTEILPTLESLVTMIREQLVNRE